MKKRAQLPSAEVLFKREGRAERQGAKASKRQSTKTLKRQSAKVLKGPKAKERLSLYLPSELWEELEEVKGQLYRKYKLKANKSQIISAILKENLSKIEELAQLLQEI
jgi:hypothetical protein